MKNPPAIKLKSYRLILWHRRTGVAAALFILLLALSGVLLNHSPELELGNKPLQSKWLLNWYGVGTAATPRHYSAAGVVISQAQAQLFINGKALWQSPKPLIGAAATDLLISLAFSDELVLFTHEGELLERITDLPEGISSISAIGNSDTGQIAVRGEERNVIADNEMIEWQPASEKTAIRWSQPLSEATPYDAAIGAANLHHDLTYERLLLDLHSGRLFGQWGPYVMDGAALAMVLLAITGLRRSWLGKGIS